MNTPGDAGPANGTNMSAKEHHFSHRSGWLRAAVLGANDGIVSTASLVLGVAAAGAMRGDILLAGSAGLIAGAMSMAAGEYVSVSSQADSEAADLARERVSLRENRAVELDELTRIYVERGLDAGLAAQVAQQLTAHDALSAHARDELGLSDMHAARPLQAALISAVTFAAGAALPLSIAAVSPGTSLDLFVAAGSLLILVALGAIAASAGGASLMKGAVRVGFWGALAMAATMAVGSVFGTIL
jgi:VIT1/CCC1 family predicted Fe2+/Mn2+ transporter